MDNERLSYCAIHKTRPGINEPCWACVNSYLLRADHWQSAYSQCTNDHVQREEALLSTITDLAFLCAAIKVSSERANEIYLALSPLVQQMITGCEAQIRIEGEIDSGL